MHFVTDARPWRPSAFYGRLSEPHSVASSSISPWHSLCTAHSFNLRLAFDLSTIIRPSLHLLSRCVISTRSADNYGIQPHSETISVGVSRGEFGFDCLLIAINSITITWASFTRFRRSLFHQPLHRGRHADEPLRGTHPRQFI